MATLADPPASPTAATGPRRSIRPDSYERVLGIAAGILFVVVLAALARGRPHWNEANAFVWAHLLTLLVALALTPVMLLQKRGTSRHRQLGWIWSIAMFSTAAVSFFVKQSSSGVAGWSPIHILSALTVVGVPILVARARQHRVDAHRRQARVLVTGALLIAGFFTFPFGRMLGRWLFG